MALALTLIAVILCIGFAVLMHSILRAPEGTEGEGGFELKSEPAPEFLSKPAMLFEPGVGHGPNANAA